MFSGIIAARRSTKRGGEVPHVPLDEVLLEVESNGIEVVALDTALCSLAKIDTRKSRVVELRYFGGLSLEETAEILQVSVETAKRDWKMARAWLYTGLASKQKLRRTFGTLGVVAAWFCTYQTGFLDP